jgi:cysteine dioxygenase
LNDTPIYNLKDLVKALKAKSEDVAYVEILGAIKFNFKDVEHLCFWDAEDYSKINIGNGDGYELVLICWENNQQSQIRGHNGQEAITYVLKGELTEEVFGVSNKNSNPEECIVLGRRAISSLINRQEKEHRLKNSFGGRSVSLHLYIK